MIKWTAKNYSVFNQVVIEHVVKRTQIVEQSLHEKLAASARAFLELRRVHP